VQKLWLKLRSSLPLVLTALFATFAVLTIPNYPYLITDALSYNTVLVYAYAHHLAFGTDVVFPYGPLGFLTSRYFFDQAIELRVVTDVLLALTVSVGVSMVAWRAKALWRWSLMATLIFVTANTDPHYDLLLYVGILSWGLLCLVESGSRLTVATTCLVLLGAFGSLAKANFLFTAVASLMAITGDLALRRKYWLAAAIIPGFAVAFLLGWFGSGQTISHLIPFLRNTVPLAQGYNAVMGLNGLQVLRFRGFIIVVLVLLTVVVRVLSAFKAPIEAPRSGIPESQDKSVKAPINAGILERCEVIILYCRRGLLFVWLYALVLIIWKHGFVRADLYHMGFFLGLAPVLLLALEVLPATSSRSLFATRVLATISWVIVVFTLQSWCFPAMPASVAQPFRAAALNLKTLFGYGTFRRESLDAQQKAFRELDLPQIRRIIEDHTVDVFGHDQIFALHNNLNYHPRPVFQSYTAYNAYLNQLNERFYLSAAAPEYVLFRLTPIDYKFPPLEDSFVLRDLVMNYEKAAVEEPYLLLRHRTNAAPRLVLLFDQTVRVGEPVDLGTFTGENLWVEFKLQPTFLGKIREFVYKPTVTRLVVWRGGKRARYKAPAPMLAAGFLASPLLLNTEDVQNFYSGQNGIRPEAYSVEFDPGGKPFWQPAAQCRIYKIENPLPNPAH
jgi:hypothetical protein